MTLRIHLVSFAIPFPADYGGVIDVYFKIKSLHRLGVKIVLHCFEYDREQAKELESVCESVHYYERKRSLIDWFSSYPFIVKSRSNSGLLEALRKDNDPILFDGLHTCFFIDHPELKGRLKYLRSHNIEHNYYKGLADVEANSLKKFYFGTEASRLEKFEKKVLGNIKKVFAISEADKNYFQVKGVDTELISAFHVNEKVDLPDGNSDYVLYHGSLDVGENNEVALYLVGEVFSKIKTKLVIAGKSPRQELIAICDKFDHIELKADVSSDEIKYLVRNAQINILPTFQATGIKLKLLISLYTGRFVLANEPMVGNTGLEDLCSTANNTLEFKDKIEYLMNSSWVQKDHQERRSQVMDTRFGNSYNAQRLKDVIAADQFQ